MSLLVILLLVAAAVCFLVVAFGWDRVRPNLLALGLLFWVLSVLLPKVIT
jgi:hypothetical protein